MKKNDIDVPQDDGAEGEPQEQGAALEFLQRTLTLKNIILRSQENM